MAKAKRHIPQSAKELTPAWFNEHVAEPLGAPPGTRIAAVDRTVIGEGIGFIGELHRCHLTWHEGDADATTADLATSVVVKIPSANDTNRAVGEALQGYEREIVVYRDLGGRLGIPMPTYFHDALDPHPAPWIDTAVIWLFDKLPVRAVNWLVLRFISLSSKSRRRYVLVMEDIEDARPPSQVDGGSLDDALSALEVLARFHAHNWMSKETAEASKLLWPIDQSPKIWQASYLRNRGEFIEKFADVVPPDKMARLDESQADIAELLHSLGEEPWTILHGDYRLDNVLYRPDGSLVVLDYQLAGRGRPGWDVAYFITTALTPDLRTEEEALLRRYHDTLVAAGVGDYSWEMLLADVETTKIVLAHRIVCSIDTLDTDMADRDVSLAHLLVGRVVGWLD